MKSGVMVAGLLAGLAVSSVGQRLQAQGEAGIAVGARAPVVTVNDLDGKPVDLGQWVGKKPVLIEFWATWCGNCEALLPRFKDAHAKFGERVEFLGVNVTVNQTPERVRRYAGEHGVPFRVLYDDKGTSTRAYMAPATSYVVIIDATGRVVYTGVGTEQQFEATLKRVSGVEG
ncbi:MAG: TlpA disulfide reductase family protein [Gemmatimonadales bacterium]